MQNNILNRSLIAVGHDNSTFEFQVNNRYEYSTKGQKLKVELIEEADGFLLISCEGVRYPVEIASVRQNEYEVLVNGVSYNFTIETPFSLKRRKILDAQKPINDSEEIHAPMPGKIVNIMVAEGQVVQPGDSLLILEAMKMQNTLTATTKGTITKIEVNLGDNVSKDDLLIEIKK